MHISPEQYDTDLKKGLRFTGDGPEYFAAKRVQALKSLCAEKKLSTARILEFGCGTGNNLASFSEIFPNSQLIGYDICMESISLARSRFGDNPVMGFVSDTADVALPVDIVFVNGVFHHIARSEHRECLERILGLLRDGGVLAFFENNPFNPGARFVMSRIPFDRDAEMINPFAASKLMLRCGFKDVEKRFYFFFPSFVACLRPLEKYMDRICFGGQYGLFAFK